MRSTCVGRAMMTPVGNPITSAMTANKAAGASTNGSIADVAATTAKPPIMNSCGRRQRSARYPLTGTDGISSQPTRLTIELACAKEYPRVVKNSGAKLTSEM